ncbi:MULTISPECIES: hypothetical protein [unclassified Micromonospora]|uniref:hypothetical protein n=1 Tax=unclassified Micromonospora TaxID=2617518 RepID=UPI0003EEDCEF|nr:MULTISPECIES: hypothetical protein [unclassified Micromonospora]EWM64138.1 hypothetical protein MCBG_01271 [Micromonospora sp. M42]MCK1806970.1 hypothetical protein [Micromonospora sp. R42106]MCK1831521.1 hypothetical protein [Micromonospora sp. R42003]MCK1844319.1 hypothetical protein [Micromonospora sp. R42004]MCM1016111.1 hypothetical protein [Micromonospora sp. XM-20-01]
MTAELRAPMTEELVWANVMRPRIPLVYLDLNTIIYIARALGGDTKVPESYVDLYKAALRAKLEQRAMFPLSGEHLWEISKITNPKQRGDLADILETLSDYNYLLGRTVIAELEFEAGMAQIMGEDISAKSVLLVRPTFGQAFGWVGGMKIRNGAGGDGSEAVRAEMSDADFDKLMARMNYEMERRMLRGPSDEDLEVLRADPNFQPEVALEGQKQRVEWELDTERVLNEHPKWRRGRLRDLIGAREIVHEWMDMYTRMRIDRRKGGMPDFEPADDELRSFMGSMPHTQVAISVKTRYHKNPLHKWTVNDIVDIDAISVAYAYCEAVFPDKAVRAALQSSKELRTIGTFVPRRPEELTDWLDSLPTVVAPHLLVPHPIPRPARVDTARRPSHLLSQPNAARDGRAG